jgi:hypothetical protein
MWPWITLKARRLAIPLLEESKAESLESRTEELERCLRRFTKAKCRLERVVVSTGYPERIRAIYVRFSDHTSDRYWFSWNALSYSAEPLSAVLMLAFGYYLKRLGYFSEKK